MRGCFGPYWRESWAISVEMAATVARSWATTGEAMLPPMAFQLPAFRLRSSVSAWATERARMADASLRRRRVCSSSFWAIRPVPPFSRPPLTRASSTLESASATSRRSRTMRSCSQEIALVDRSRSIC